MRKSINRGITVGVFGLGSIGIRHARILIERDINVLGYDVSLNANHAAQKLSIQTLPKKTIADEASHFIICTPSEEHIRDINFLCKFGKPILVEKPLGTNYSETIRAIGMATAYGTDIFVAHNLRQRRVIREFCKIIKKLCPHNIVSADFYCGSYLPDWRPMMDYRTGYAAKAITGGVTFDNIHEIDLALHIFGPGYLLSSTLINTQKLEISAEDYASLVIRHDSGVITNISLNYHRQPSKRSIEVVLTNSTIKADLRKGRIVSCYPDGTQKVEFEKKVDRDLEYDLQTQYFLNSKYWNKLCTGREALDSLMIATSAKKTFKF